MKYQCEGKIKFENLNGLLSFYTVISNNIAIPFVDSRDSCLLDAGELTISFDLRLASKTNRDTIVYHGIAAKSVSDVGIIKQHTCLDEDGGQCTDVEVVDTWGEYEIKLIGGE